jgi:glycosyltransferase involved in cell wall biosynthesis
MKILIAISSRWWNATAYYAISLAEALTKSGHHVYIASDPGYPPAKKALDTGLEVIDIRFASLNPLILLIDWFKLYSIVKEKKIDIIHSHNPEDHLISALVASKLKIPLLRTLSDVRPPKDNFINRWLHFKRTDFHISSSDSNLIRYYSTWRDFEPKCSVISGGVKGEAVYKISKRSELLEKFKIPSGSKIVGIIARLAPVKDHATFIMAASLVFESVPDAYFLICGSEAEITRNELKALAENVNLNSNIVFSDHYEPVNELMSLLDVGVISSKGSEVISRVAMEYLAIGVPVVATDVNVLPEIIEHGRNGYIVPPENPYEMSEAIIKILKDQSLKEKISDNNISDFKNKFEMKIVAKSVLNIYHNLIES